jgi:hypothetical protein
MYTIWKLPIFGNFNLPKFKTKIKTQYLGDRIDRGSEVKE